MVGYSLLSLLEQWVDGKIQWAQPCWEINRKPVGCFIPPFTVSHSKKAMKGKIRNFGPKPRFLW
jgi:hypothetical protein